MLSSQDSFYLYGGGLEAIVNFLEPVASPDISFRDDGL
jgi:hypothetical protein